MSTINKPVYIGADRRSGQDRRYRRWHCGPQDERRNGSDRRQDALAGIIVGLSVDDMIALAEVWESIDERT